MQEDYEIFPYSNEWAEYYKIPSTNFTPVPKGIPERNTDPWWGRLKRLVLIDIPDWPRKFKFGIKNLRVWFGIIWDDRNWDQVYLWKILLKKLQLMEGEPDVSSVPHPGDAALSRCVAILTELIRRDSCDCAHMGEPGCQFGDCLKEQKEMLADLGMLIGKYSNTWWD